MLKELKRYGVIVFSIATFSGCTYVENADSAALPVSSNDVALLDVKLCRTFGFRNWSLQRDEGTVTLSGEASMPTPAWSVVLHQGADAGNDKEAIELVMETIEPAGLSSSIVSWVSFEKVINTELATTADIAVKCAGESIWTS